MTAVLISRSKYNLRYTCTLWFCQRQLEPVSLYFLFHIFQNTFEMSVFINDIPGLNSFSKDIFYQMYFLCVCCSQLETDTNTIFTFHLLPLLGGTSSVIPDQVKEDGCRIRRRRRASRVGRSSTHATKEEERKADQRRKNTSKIHHR